MWRFLRIVSYIIILLTVVVSIFLYFRLKDRHSGYEVDIDIPAGEPSEFKIGFGAISITPVVTDTWTDANQDGRYVEDDGDSYQDNNGNGKFDAVWMAGFSNRRPANGIHDDLWARAMVIDDGSTRLAMAVIDAIGLGSDDVIESRQMIPDSMGIDYCIIISTHTHEAPDLIGIWGESETSSGVDPVYRQHVHEKIAEAVTKAVENLQPAWIRISRDLRGGKPLVEDTRLPIVTDPGIRIIQVLSKHDNSTLGTVFSWANHPEVLWDKNLLISSDFPHYVREYLEKGIFDGDSLLYNGLEGTTLYLNGAIGGLMTLSPDRSVTDPVTKDQLLEPSFAKADALGKNLAILGFRALSGPYVDTVKEASLSLKGRSLKLKLKNPLFRFAAIMKVIDRGMNGFFKIRSEVAYWSLGPAGFVHVPGEIYPEIVNGGIESPSGQDYDTDPVEIPPIREMMPEKYKFVVGMSNDMIGYIIPKSQWDQKYPPTYIYAEPPYGEINSLGPDTAPEIHRAIMELVGDPTPNR